MTILSTPGWSDYELIDSGYEQRLERFGDIALVRPDPQALWEPKLDQKIWKSAHAFFKRESGDKGKWIFNSKVSDRWSIHYKDLSIILKLTPFKHTGLFPEQSLQWDWMSDKIASSETQPNVLNLFAYTGIASLALASAGAKVTHLDASKPAMNWFRENQSASNLLDKPIRLILDDALKFTAREIKRGVKYDGILMDPPIYGHGPKGERWDFHTSFPQLLKNCRELLSEKPLFVVVNAYAISASALMLENMLNDCFGQHGGKVEAGELALQESGSQRLLSTGIFGRWSQN